MPGRKQNKGFEALNFQLKRTLIKGKVKYSALCLDCLREISNTSENRLLRHKNICVNAKQTSNRIEYVISSDRNCIKSDKQHTRKSSTSRVIKSEREQSPSSSSALSINNMSFLFDDAQLRESNIEIEYLDKAEPVNNNTPKFARDISYVTTSIFGNLRKSSSYTGKTGEANVTYTTDEKHKDIDTVSKEEETHIQEALSNFFFGCNIPLSVVESDHFKNLIKALRPAYLPKLPGRKELKKMC